MLGAVLALAVCALTASAGTATGASAALSRQVPKAGTGTPQTGEFTPSGSSDATSEEFDIESEDGPNAYDGTISLSTGAGGGGQVSSSKKAKSNPQFQSGFEGLNLFQQRYARGGNQFTVEPPDQGMCVGNGYVVEAVNDVLNVFNQSGQSVLPDNTSTNIVSGFPTNVNHAVDLNSFYGYAPAVNRTTGVRAQGVTDPSCLYDAATQRFFVVVLTLERFPNGANTTVNHLDIAVSQTSNPTGSWNIYRVDVTNDGTNSGGVNPGPYLGDYPHIGADANGFYITTNSYPWCGTCFGFSGAQIYAISKAQLAAGAAIRERATHRHLGDGQRAERGGSATAGLHRLARPVPGNRLVQHRERGHGVLHELERRGRGSEARLRLERDAYFEPARGLDADQHCISELGDAGAQLEQQGSEREPVWRSPEAAAARVGQPADDGCTAGLLHQRHHHPDNRGRRVLEARVQSARAGAQRGHLEARLERHADAAGHVREREALGSSRHLHQSGRWACTSGYRVLHRQSVGRQGRQPGLSRRGWIRLHVSRDRRHSERSWRDGFHGNR